MKPQYSKRKTVLAVGSIITFGLAVIGFFIHFNSWSIVPAEVETNLELATNRYDSIASYADEELATNGFTEEFYEQATYAAEIADKQSEAIQTYNNIVEENKSRNIFQTNAAWFFLAAIITLAITLVVSFRV